MISLRIQALVDTLARYEAQGHGLAPAMVPVFRRQLAAIAADAVAMEATAVPPAARWQPSPGDGSGAVVSLDAARRRRAPAGAGPGTGGAA